MIRNRGCTGRGGVTFGNRYEEKTPRLMGKGPVIIKKRACARGYLSFTTRDGQKHPTDCASRSYRREDQITPNEGASSQERLAKRNAA